MYTPAVLCHSHQTASFHMRLVLILTGGHRCKRAGRAWVRHVCAIRRRPARRRAAPGLAGLALPAQADAGRRSAPGRRRRPELHTHARRHVRSGLDMLHSRVSPARWELDRRHPECDRGSCKDASLGACPSARKRLPVLHHSSRPLCMQPSPGLRCIRRPIRVESALFEGTVRVWVKVRRPIVRTARC